MDIPQLIHIKKEIYDHILEVIENEDLFNDGYLELQQFLENQQINENKIELQELLNLILQIFSHHYRHQFFINNIEKIIIYLIKNNSQNFTNFELFQIFESSKLIIYLLLTNNLITFDKNIVEYILKNTNRNYYHFFYPEIEKIVDDKVKNDIKNDILKDDPNCFENFEEKRRNGENDSYLSSLIRNDSIEEFVAFSNKIKLSLSNTTIEPSIFETNLFLIENHSTLIEYATFYGSIQIFKYLQYNNVNLEQSLWLYAIHSNNGEMIHLLEENDVQLDNELLEKIYEESIKCHHNDITIYIENNKIMHASEIKVDACFRYFNYKFLPNDFNNKLIFYYACKYNHLSIVEILLKNKILDLEYKIILNIFFFSNESIILIRCMFK